MFLKVDEESKCVIAKGTCKGYNVKAVANCHKDDKFDPDFGKKIAKSKYKIREAETQLRYHKKIISELNEIVLKCFDVLSTEQKICDSIEQKIQTRIKEYDKVKENNEIR